MYTFYSIVAVLYFSIYQDDSCRIPGVCTGTIEKRMVDRYNVICKCF